MWRLAFKATLMTRVNPADGIAATHYGATLGAAPALAAFMGHTWGGIGTSSVGMLVLLVLSGALLGSMTWITFEDDVDTPSIAFSALFSAISGMLIGAFITFPLGAVFGSVAGLVGGASCALTWRWAATSSRPWGFASRALLTVLSGSSVSAALTGWVIQ